MPSIPHKPSEADPISDASKEEDVFFPPPGLPCPAYLDTRRPLPSSCFGIAGPSRGDSVLEHDKSKQDEYKSMAREACAPPVWAGAPFCNGPPGLDHLSAEELKPLTQHLHDFDEIPKHLLEQSDWSTAFSHPWEHKANILHTEALALFWSLKHQLRSKRAFGTRLLAFVDNLPLCLNTNKRRGSSGHLKGPLRQITALLLCSICSLHCRWIPSEWNVADTSSRLLSSWAARGLKCRWISDSHLGSAVDCNHQSSNAPFPYHYKVGLFSAAGNTAVVNHLGAHLRPGIGDEDRDPQDDLQPDCLADCQEDQDSLVLQQLGERSDLLGAEGGEAANSEGLPGPHL